MLPCVPLSPLLFLCLQGYFCQFPKQIGYIISFFLLICVSSPSPPFSPYDFLSVFPPSYSTIPPPFPTIPHRFPPFPIVFHHSPPFPTVFPPFPTVYLRCWRWVFNHQPLNPQFLLIMKVIQPQFLIVRFLLKLFFYWLLLNSVWCSIY